MTRLPISRTKRTEQLHCQCHESVFRMHLRAHAHAQVPKQMIRAAKQQPIAHPVFASAHSIAGRRSSWSSTMNQSHRHSCQQCLRLERTRRTTRTTTKMMPKTKNAQIQVLSCLGLRLHSAHYPTWTTRPLPPPIDVVPRHCVRLVAEVSPSAPISERSSRARQTFRGS